MGIITPKPGTSTIAGPILVQWNGKDLAVEGDHTYNKGVHKSEVVQGPDGTIHGTKKTPQPGKIAGKVAITASFQNVMDDFLAAEGATITFYTPTGAILTLTDAMQVSEGDVSTENGTMDYEFNGTFE